MEGRLQPVINVTEVQATMTSYQQLLSAITDYIGLDTVEDSRQLCEEAQVGNKVAQYIVGMALAKVDELDSERWLRMSALQGYEPAIQHFLTRESLVNASLGRGQISLASS